MPFNFSGSMKSNVAKLGVVFDGDTFTVDGYGTTVTSTLASNTVFTKNPVRSATGVWSVVLKDVVNEFMVVDVKTVLASGHYLSVQLNSTSLDSQNRPVLNWTFNSAGTPADLPANAKFEVFVCYSESSGN